jgi:hypothetical protein
VVGWVFYFLFLEKRNIPSEWEERGETVRISSVAAPTLHNNLQLPLLADVLFFFLSISPCVYVCVYPGACFVVS